ncbi:MAG TPA: glycoside hydrolase family 43 protein [Polyangiaceae bacterium]|nr:glycoside hydrolase family 43 protein [Polyangiaceae bacterium]
MYRNPILPGFYPDPSLCRVGADYYLATSSFEYFPGVPIFHSRDLVHWRQLGHALTRPSQVPLDGAKSSGGIFAPTLREHRGVFYLITSNVSRGANFYVTARDPAGPWSDPVWLHQDTFGIDPSLLFDEDGRVYYTRHGDGERGAIYQAELSLADGQLRQPARAIWPGTGGIWPEGPHLYRIAGRYYLLISEGGTSTGHRLTTARSSSPFGPFEPCPDNPILTHSTRPEQPIQATGHGDLVQLPSGEWWIVFLGIRRWDGAHHHLGRETFLAPVRWNADGWPVINEGRPIGLEMSSHGLPAPHPWPQAATRDDFEQPELALCWNFLRNPAPGSWSSSERPGWLRLHGSEASLDDVSSPAFVGRRQQHLRCRARARLQFAPEHEGQRAGLTLRANEANHHDLVLTHAGRERRVQLWTRIAGNSTLIAERATPSSELVLELEAFPDRYELSFRDSGGHYPLGHAPTAPLSSESAGGFTGVYIGLFASNASSARMPPADFDWLDYEPAGE